MGTAPVWTVGEALDWTVRYFEERSVDEPRRSAEWLLSAATDLSRIELYAFRARPLTPDERAAFREGIKQRAEGMPLQYVTGEVPFRHLVLDVRPGVFIPRPETEILVDIGLESLSLGGVREPLVIDLCTGSGAVAVSLAFEQTSARVWATDLSPEAVECASANAARAGVAERVRILHGNLFDSLPQELLGRADLILANPPYIPSARIQSLPGEVATYEPGLALDGGADGLDAVRRIIKEAGKWLAPGGAIAIEIDETHSDAAHAAMREDFGGVLTRKDLAGRDRFVSGYKEVPR